MFAAVTLALALQQAPIGLKQINAAVQYAKSAQTHALIISIDEKVVSEDYWSGTSEDYRMMASGSKTMTGIAALAAVQDGLIQLSDLAKQYHPSWATHPEKSTIKLRDLLELCSGLQANLAGLTTGGPTWEQLVALPMARAVGSFEYGPVHQNVFAAALDARLGSQTFENYLQTRVLQPMGVQLDWRFRGTDGNPQVAGGGYIRAKDWLKVGQLLAANGNWRGVQILPTNTLAELTKPSVGNANYGLSVWLSPNAETILRDKSSFGTRLLPERWPTDFFMAAGFGKQRLYVVPSRGLVAVRMGGGTTFSDTEFMDRLLGVKQVVPQ